MPELETSPLYINPDDTRDEVADLIRKSEGKRLLLILAGHTDSRIDIVDLRLLQRMAVRNGKQLAIATRNPTAIDAADHLGIPHFRTPAQARRAAWPVQAQPAPSPERTPIDRRKQPQRYQPLHKTHQWWKWALTGGFLFLVGIIGLLFFSRATVLVRWIPTTQTMTFEATAAETVRSATLAGLIPLHTSAIILENTASGSTSGVLNFPEGYASGILTITNLTTETLEIPAGLTVQTLGIQPVQFLTNQAVSLAPAGDEDEKDSIRVEITARTPGREGNVMAGEIRAVAGEFGSSISVNNPAGMFGGYNRFVDTPSDSDVEAVRNTLLGEMLTEAEKTYAEDMTAEELVLLTETIAIDEIVSEEIVPMQGEPAEEFHLTLRVRFTANYIDPADVEQTAIQLLDADLEEKYIPVDTGRVSILPASAPIANEDGTYGWSLLLSREVIPDLSQVDLQSFAGQPKKKLEQWLSATLPEIDELTISSKPRFWWWLPVLPQRMEVIIL